MSTVDREELLAAFLAGELSADGRRQLATALKTDASFAATARELLSLERLLEVTLGDRERDRFTWATTERIRKIAEEGSDSSPEWKDAELSEAELETVAGGGDPLPPEPEKLEDDPPEDGLTPPPPPAP